MGEGAEVSELQQRVDAVGLRFSEIAKDSRRRGERLASLLDQVEKGVVEDRREIERLKAALAEAQEQNAEILALLETVLTQVENVDGPNDRIVLCDLEARVDRLHNQAAAVNGSKQTAKAAKPKPPQSGNGAATAVGEKDGEQEGARDSAAKPAVGGTVKDGPAAEITQMIPGDRGSRSPARTETKSADSEAGAVQDIFNRVSLMTGRLRES